MLTDGNVTDPLYGISAPVVALMTVIVIDESAAASAMYSLNRAGPGTALTGLYSVRLAAPLKLSGAGSVLPSPIASNVTSLYVIWIGVVLGSL